MELVIKVSDEEVTKVLAMALAMAGAYSSPATRTEERAEEKEKSNFYAQPLRRERLFADVAATDDKRAWMQKKITVAMQDICNDEEKTSAFITAINYMAQKIDPEVQKASELKDDEARAELVDRINDLFWDGKKFVEKEPF